MTMPGVQAGYGARGKPGISPAQLAMVTVLQFTENLTDRQAADAVRGRPDWEYFLGLELAGEGVRGMTSGFPGPGGVLQFSLVWRACRGGGRVRGRGWRRQRGRRG